MSQRHYSSYLSKLDATAASSSFQSASALERRRKSHVFQSNYENDDYREPRSHPNTEKFSSDATVNTNMLYDAIDDVLDSRVQRGAKESRLRYTPPPPPPPPPPRPSSNIRSLTPTSYSNSLNTNHYSDSRSTYNVRQSPSQRREGRTTPLNNDYVSVGSRPTSHFEDRSVSYNDDNYRYSRSDYTSHHRKYQENERHPPPYEQERYNSSSYHRGDSSVVSDRRGNLDHQRDRDYDRYRRDNTYSNNSRYAPDHHQHSGNGRPGDSYQHISHHDEYSKRRRDTYNLRSGDDNSIRRGDTYTPLSRDSYGERRHDPYSTRSGDNYIDAKRDTYTVRPSVDYSNRGRETFTIASSDVSHTRSRQSYSAPRPSTYRDSYDNRIYDNRVTMDTASIGDVSRYRSRNQSTMYSSQLHSGMTSYEFPHESMIHHQHSHEKEDKRQIVINVHTNPSVPSVDSRTQEPSKAASVNLNYSDILAANSSHHSIHLQNHQASRGTMPPKNPASKIVENDDASDISSVTGMPKTVRARSVITNTSTASHWKNSDVIYLPKNQSVAEASVTAAAAASVIVDDVQKRFSFDTAVKSVSNILKSNDEGKVEKADIVSRSISRDDLYELNDDTVVPVSFKTLRQNVREVMREKESQKAENPLETQMDASDFYARCAVLAATAIMKADPTDKAIIAQTAAETILSFHKNIRSKDWLQAADDNLKDVSVEVSKAIKDLPVSNTNAMASLASISVMSEGGKSLAMERIRQRVNQSTSMEINEIIDNEQEKDKEEEDIINPIRNKGSLMDNLAGSDDSDAESVEIKKSPLHSQNRNTSRSLSMNPSREKIYPPILKVPSLSLSTNAETMEQASRGHRSKANEELALRGHRSEPNEHVKSAVQKLLSSASDENMSMNESSNIRTKMSYDLDRKQAEIAKRIQRIQMRAAGKSEEEIAVAVGQLSAFSSDFNSSNDFNSRLTDDVDFKASRAKKKKNHLDNVELISELPSAQEIIGGIGNVLSAGKTYLEGLNLNNIKLPLLPQCKVELDDLDENDNYNDLLQEGNMTHFQQHEHQPIRNSENKMSSIEINSHEEFGEVGGINNHNNIHPTIIQTQIPSPHSGLSDDEHDEQGWTSYRSPPQERMSFELKKPPSYESSPQYNALDHDNNVHNISLSKIRSTDTGAFSAAFRNGDFSSIPIQKLSLVPPGSDSSNHQNDHNEDKTKDRFYSTSRGPTTGKGSSYDGPSHGGDDGRHYIETKMNLNYDRGMSERKGLLRDVEMDMEGITASPKDKVRRKKMFSRKKK